MYHINSPNLISILTIGNFTKNNIVLPTSTKNRVSEQPTKNIVPENEITITQLQQQHQNEQQKEEILEARKRPESYEKSWSSF